MKKYINILILSFISIIVISCSNNEKNEVECPDCTNYLFEVESTQILENMILLEKTTKLVSNFKKANLNGVEFDIKNTTISEYKDSEFNSIVVPQKNVTEDKVTYSFVTYSYEDKIFNGYLIVRIEELGENFYNTQYINSSNIVIGEITVQDNIVISTVTYNSNKESWNACIKRAIDRMSSGTTEGNVEALLCFAFGPSCAAGTAIGCLGVSLFS